MPIDWEQADDIGVAVINRPERRNALNVELAEELRDRVLNSHLRAVVITGAGDKAFCAGADLSRRTNDLGRSGSDRFRPAFDQLLDSVVTCPAPVLAAVNGAALGAGMQLAVACDLRVVAPQAIFGIPAGRSG